jgi:hypothetical protein
MKFSLPVSILLSHDLPYRFICPISGHISD